MTSYTTYTKVSEELNNFTLDASSTPTSTVVNTWITEASKLIELNTNQVWASTVVSSEYHDYDGSGIFKTYHSPIITITELLAESNGINSESLGWHTLEEGKIRTKDFYQYSDEGDIIFHGTEKPSAGYQNLCISYSYGYATTPIQIQTLATKIVATRVINSVINGSASSEGGAVSVGTISVSDPSTFGISRIKEMNQEIKDLYGSIGKFKVYRLDRRY